jgi:hypothetical protein
VSFTARSSFILAMMHCHQIHFPCSRKAAALLLVSDRRWFRPKVSAEYLAEYSVPPAETESQNSAFLNIQSKKNLKKSLERPGGLTPKDPAKGRFFTMTYSSHAKTDHFDHDTL